MLATTFWSRSSSNPTMACDGVFCVAVILILCQKSSKYPLRFSCLQRTHSQYFHLFLIWCFVLPFSPTSTLIVSTYSLLIGLSSPPAFVWECLWSQEKTISTHQSSDNTQALWSVQMDIDGSYRSVQSIVLESRWTDPWLLLDKTVESRKNVAYETAIL